MPIMAVAGGATMEIARLKGRKKFDELFVAGTRYRSYSASCIVLYYGREEEKGNTSVGVAVSKRSCRSSVKRNRLKRLLRESVRQIADENPAAFAEIGTLLLYWNREPAHPALVRLPEVKEEVARLIGKISAGTGKKTKQAGALK